MLNAPMDILKVHPIRKTAEQKEAFRTDILALARDMGYEARVEAAGKKTNNIIIGDPRTAKYLITAHYDTPASIGIPNILFPCNFPAFILWQILIVGIFVAAALVSGGAAFLLTRSGKIAFLAGYIVYFGMLALMMFGPANKNNVNDNSSGVITLLETAKTLQTNQRSKVCFLLFDLEERGMVGSKAYRKAHREETEHQIVLNLDCVGDGDHILFFPTKKAKKNEKLMKDVHRIGGWFGKKQILLKKDGFYVYPSDQRSFPVALGIAAFHKAKFLGYYCDKIHTKKDTILEETNVNLLRAALTTIICGDAVN